MEISHQTRPRSQLLTFTVTSIPNGQPAIAVAGEEFALDLSRFVEDFNLASQHCRATGQRCGHVVATNARSLIPRMMDHVLEERPPFSELFVLSGRSDITFDSSHRTALKLKLGTTSSSNLPGCHSHLHSPFATMQGDVRRPCPYSRSVRVWAHL